MNSNNISNKITKCVTTRIIRTKRLNNLCRLIFLLLFLLWLLWLLLLRCDIVVVHLEFWYYRRSTWHSEECNWAGSGQSDVPLVQTSGGQEWYYGRSTSYSEECNWEGSGQSDIPLPSRGIWWPGMVLWQINFTFWKNAIEKALDSQTYSPEYRHLVANYWYYRRSTSHSEQCNGAGSGQSDIPPPWRGIWWTQSSTTS